MQSDPEPEVSQFQASVRQTISEVSKQIVNLESVTEEILISLLCGGHVLLEGVPGLGKTMLVQCLSKCLGLETNRIQFTPDLMPSDILGAHILTEDGGPHIKFSQGPVFTQILLADEINRCTPKTQAALLEAMQERQVTIGGQRLALDKLFFCIATQNPIEMEGTYPLPEAQLDRFFFKIHVPSPDINTLKEISRRTTGGENPKISRILDADLISRFQSLIREVAVPKIVENAAATLIYRSSPTSDHAPEVTRYVRYGASPRGMQTLILGAKAKALIAGRYAASVRDVADICLPSLRHRIILNYEAEAERVSTDEVLKQLVASCLETDGPDSR